MTATSPSSAVRSRFLDLRAMDALGHMRFVTRHRIEGAYSGRHRSRQRGGSAEFVDHREYSPGEDLRRIDWKLLARTGRPYVRQYQDETNLRCTLLLDASGSMSFAGRSLNVDESKLQYVQRLATAISQVVSAQRDQVGLGLAADGLTEFLPPGGTGAHVWRVQNAIENLRATPASQLSEALRQLFDRSTGRGVLIVMSDFLVDDLDTTFAPLRLFKHRRWEVIVLHVIHPDEERLPQGPAYRFDGMENDGSIDCTPTTVAAAYEEAFGKHCAAVRSLSLAAGCDYRRVSTSTPYLETLGGFLVERAG